MALAYGDVRRLVEQPESETLEVVHIVPHHTELARIIAAFANTAGGVILFGVRDDKPWPDRLVGIDESRLRKRLDRALQRIQPRPNVSITVPQIEGKWIGAVEVAAPVDAFTMVSGQAWARVGDKVLPATVDQILSRVHREPASSRDRDAELAQLVDVVVSQAGIIEELNEGRQQRNLAPVITVAGLVGFVLGCLLMLAVT